MAIGGQNTALKKRKGAKKQIDPFLRKEWYAIKAPTYFAKRVVGVVPVTKTTGQKTARDSLIGRVIELPVADLAGKGDEFRKFSLKVDDVQGVQCLTSFHGMDFTTDKIRSLVKKRQDIVEAVQDVKTSDGYHLRVFVTGFTKRQIGQKRASTYAQRAHHEKLRRRTQQLILRELNNVDIATLVTKAASEVIGTQVQKISRGIFPLQNVFTRKIKVVRAPKGDAGRLMELHGGVEAIMQFQREFEASNNAAPADEAAAVEAEVEVEEILAE